MGSYRIKRHSRARKDSSFQDDLELQRSVLLDDKESSLFAVKAVDAWAERNIGLPDESFLRFLKVIVRGNMDHVIRLCESPIERLFFGSVVTWCAVNNPLWLIVAPNRHDGEYFTGPMYENMPVLYDSVHMEIQPNFTDDDGSVIRPDGFWWVPGQHGFSGCMVECDGFQFHSSRDAFVKDKQRDRLFQSYGYSVLRFSGSEIYANPSASAASFIDLVESIRPHGREC